MRNFDRFPGTGTPPDRVADFILRVGETFETLGPQSLHTTEFWSYSRIEAAVQKLSRAAISHHKVLKNIINNDFDTIQKRWTRKSKKQREALLSEAWPSLPDAPCGDLTLYREGVREGLTDEQRNAYLLPQINRAQLSQEAALLTWILARGRHQPHEFFRFDISRTKTAENGAKMLAFLSISDTLKGYSRLMHGDTKGRPDLYGKLVKYRNVHAFEETIARDDMAVPGVGLLALEMEAKMNEFLVKCCKLILHDSPASRIQPSFPGRLWPQLTTGTSSIAASVARRVFNGSHITDYDTMIMITSTKVEAMRDHLFGMREDPGYFEQVIIEIKEHIPIVFQIGLFDGIFQQQSQAELATVFPFLFAGYLSALFSQLRLWTALHSSLVDLKDEAKHLSTNKTKHGRAAARTFGRARTSTLSLVVPLLEETTLTATLSFFASPQHRDKYAFGNPFKREIIMHPDRTLSETGRKIEWMMNELHNNKAGYLGYESFVVEIGNYLDRKTGQEREMLSSYTADHLASLAILFLCRTELDHSSYMLSKAFPDYSDLSKMADDVESEGKRRNCCVLLAVHPDLMAMQSLFDGRFNYPAHKTRTQTIVEQMRHAEALLDDWWTRLLQHMDENSCAVPELCALLNTRTMTRTRTRNNHATTIPSQHDNKAIISIAEPSTGKMRQTKEHFRNTPSPPKLKIKTRPPIFQQHISDLKSRPSTTVLEPAPTGAVYKVDKRSLKVFRVLFFHAAPSSQPGEISWHDFLHAMTCIGFSASKLYGSVWLFTPCRELAKSGAIQFHEPHPGKLAFVIARRFGRWLGRRYGWSGEMFDLK